jgi:hypothetical protein
MKKITYAAGIPLLAASLLVASCSSTPPKKDTLQTLIKAGKYQEAKDLFGNQDVNEVDEDGNTALHIAAMMDEADLVNFLIVKGAKIELKNKDGNTPLLLAAKNNAKNAGSTLTLYRADIFAKDADGKTALELAVAQGEDWYPTMINPQTASLSDGKGQGIVHYFVRARNAKAIQQCIEQKLDISKEDDNGRTPLMVAYEAPKDYEAFKIAAMLIQADSKLAGGDFDYFEKAVVDHNPLHRFEDGQTPLHISTILGHDGAVDYFLNEKTTIPMEKILRAQNISGSTPLHEAVRYGRVDTAKKFLERGAFVDSLDAMGNTPLLLQIPKENQGEMYRLLISRKANTAQKDTFGDTVLHKATLSDSPVSSLEILTEAGAPINERNKQGSTPLAIAIDNGIKEHITFYAEHGADIYAADKSGLTPLDRAIKSNSLEIFQTLINEKNVNSKDSNGNTPLHIAIMQDAPMPFLNYLIDNGADVNARNSSGDSVLLMAAQKNKKDAGELLLQHGADIFATNTENNSPLRVAFMDLNVEKWFINSETMLMRDGSGNTPLHYAAEWKYKKSAEMLIDKGAAVNAVNANGESAVFAATKGNSPELIDLLVSKGAIIDSRSVSARDNLGNTPVHAAVKWDSGNAAKTLLSHGVDVNAQNLNGKTALSEACKSGKKEFSLMLIEKGANVNATDNQGRTVLMDAVQSQNVEIVNMLLSRGANVNVQDLEGKSAYHEAALSKKIGLIKTIREAGGNPLSRDKAGNTPLSLVFDCDKQTIKAVLGSDTSIVDSDGNTPVHIAVEKKVGKPLLEMLLDSGYPVSQRNGKGVTALNIAVSDNSKELAMALLERGADPFLASTDGKNPITTVLKTKNTYLLDAIVKYNKNKADMQGDGILHYAARYADEESVKHLLALGLDKSSKNISGETAEKMAARWGRPEIAEILK